MSDLAMSLLTGGAIGLAVAVRHIRDNPFWQDWQARRRAPPGPTPSREFAFYPGQPDGYAGYTDFTALRVTINDDLVPRDAGWQFSTIGFAIGFLDGLLTRTADGSGDAGTFHLADATDDDAAMIGWLAYVQRVGTDNAGPSTSFLASAIRVTGRDISVTGPYRQGYWAKIQKRREGRSERSRYLTGSFATPAGPATAFRTKRAANCPPRCLRRVIVGRSTHHIAAPPPNYPIHHCIVSYMGWRTMV